MERNRVSAVAALECRTMGNYIQSPS